jgi:hypothetical protein
MNLFIELDIFWSLETGQKLFGIGNDISADVYLPALSTTQAFGTSPHFSSGTGMTATS